MELKYLGFSEEDSLFEHAINKFAEKEGLLEEAVRSDLERRELDPKIVDKAKKAGFFGVLTPREFSILYEMVKQPGRVFTRLDLLLSVFGYDYEGLERTIDVHIMNLRKKIEPDPEHPTYIQTVYGIGYKFAETADGA